MKISASLYSSKDTPLPQLMQELDNLHIDYIHIDCNDDLSVFDDIEEIRTISRTPIDIHIISDDPAKFYPALQKHRPELVTFQHENLRGPLPPLPVGVKSRIGVAFVSDTPIEAFEHYRPLCSFVLFMTTVPGQSGGQFDQDTFQKIRQFQERYPGTRIHVDGGVNDEVSFILRNMGVYCSVSGSYLMQAKDKPGALLRLRSPYIEGQYRVRDFMILRHELPVIAESDANDLRQLLVCVHESRQGFALVADADGKLAGIVTDRDIRAALIKHLDDLEAICSSDLINPRPVTVDGDSTIGQMLELIRDCPFPIRFLPVVDSDNTLIGAIAFNNLIKGEL
ncbi:CBS domain-containing protein [Desulfurispira natronophila]|uniref:Pentose-5-phosphate-3-epimerase/predicted transcriptional regulator n=1 Tax=Desulfurispira natronophila TaxID=682562 RepID=A0A7W7Y5T8_9BACT|nr:CBS domain-containing protein [Desulfurispira natronophila]MBB5022347.1 pentose-5-phosphate-3-epimerase/predicted transcriptional regulator [Desulfurispira natronophila]